MANFTEIANLVATLVGTQANITDPDDNRLVARTVRQVWDAQRRATLRDGEFNFACRRAGLASLAGASRAGVQPYPFANVYQLPAEALRLVELIDDIGRDEYRLEGRWIFSDRGGPLYVRYCIDVVEPADWDAAFVDAFAKRIALTTGKKIAGSAYDAALGAKLYQEAISAAKSVDARENPPLEQEESDWITARHTGWCG